MLRKFLLLPFLFALLFCFNSKILIAQTTTTDTCKDKSGQEKVDCYSGLINNLQGQAQTLSSQIAVMDAQINLTQSRIDATKQQISNLSLDIDTATKKITGLQSSLNSLVKVLLNRMVATYEVGQIQPFGILLSSNDVSNFFSRLNYLKLVQSHDKQLIYLTQQAKNDYTNQKNIFQDKKAKIEALKAQLESYTVQLDQEKQAKQDLLAQTQGDETTFENLRQQALAQLASFASFADSQGASLLPPQTSCDGWGCYYNQRDSTWGSILVNGSNDCNGPCSIARVGCLITSLAMMISHLGHNDVLPSDIANSGNSNFSVGTADLRKGTINVKGYNVTRTTVASSLNPNLVSSNPVIVGIYYGPFGTHFVVIKSYTNGQYIMNDPYTDGGKDKNFTDYYSLNSVFEVDTVSM